MALNCCGAGRTNAGYFAYVFNAFNRHHIFQLFNGCRAYSGNMLAALPIAPRHLIDADPRICSAKDNAYQP